MAPRLQLHDVLIGITDHVYFKRYQVTVVDRNPDSDLPDQVQNLPLCQFSRFFTADNLNHFVFNLFF
jgi:hypothetical protein